MVYNTMYMLDYTTRDIIRTIELFPDYPSRDERYIIVNKEILKSALQHHESKAKAEYTQIEIAIRDNFDCFFNYFEILDQYLEAKLITEEELKPYLKYWILTIGGESLPKDIRNIIHTYIDLYNFKGTQNLFKRYEKNIIPNTTLD